MAIIEILVLFIALTVVYVEGYITCGVDYTQQCLGTGAYCCGLNNDECCWETVYSFWWFWFIWFMAVVFIISCSICICIRRRRYYAAQRRYVVVDGTPQSYGTMPQVYGYPSSATGTTNYQHTVVHGMPSAPAYQEKPPEYSAIVGN